MKVLINFSKVLLIVGLLFSCEKEGDFTRKNGYVRFNYKQPQNPGGKVLTSEPAFVLVTILENNIPVEQSLVLPLFSFGSGYVSEPIQLPVGDYTLSEFLILDSENNIIYACPIEGSEMAPLVKDPLPIDFNVTENGNSLVTPQVLPVTEDQTPESFGYVSFGFEIIQPLAPNTIRLSLDGETWTSTFADQVQFPNVNNYLRIGGTKVLEDSTQESVEIIVNDFMGTTGEVLSDSLIISMELGDSYYSNGGEPVEVFMSITQYDTVTNEISGTFSGYIYNPAHGGKKTITNGIFYRLKLKPNIATETTVTFQPDGADGVDAWLGNNLERGYNTHNFGSHPDFMSSAWTADGDMSNVRSLLYFDLTSIPAEAEIDHAILSLYGVNSAGNGSHSTLSGSNASVLQKVTSPWNENTVTWDTQPGTTDLNQVIVPESTFEAQDYHMDVTNLIRDLHANPESNYGLKLKLVTEERYRKLVFASSDNPDSTKRPKLEITYKH
jgi:hypothetical protein